MEINVIVPSMGESITNAIISNWFVNDGDFIEKNSPLYELETDKITSEVNAEVSGIVHTKANIDDEVEIGAIIATIEEKEIPKDFNVESKRPEIPKDNESIVKKVEEVEEVELKKDKSDKEERKKMSPLRKKISQRLVNAKQETALLTTFNEVDMYSLMKLRKEKQEEFIGKHGIKLGFMSFFTNAVVKALQDIPSINSRIEGEYIIKQKYFDIGIAVGTEKGLMVPVVRDCNLKSSAEIEKSISNYANKARENKIELADLEGGVFTISNGGIYGSMLSTPIINFPQPAILGLHNIQERPVVVDGEIVIRPIMYLALSYDHRLIDGKEAVSFLINIKESIENPLTIFND